MDWGSVELEPEVRDWLDGLPVEQFARAAFYVDLLAEQGPLLGEPYTKQLDGKLRELRFHLDIGAVRVTYWIASGRRIVLLTVFTKTRMRGIREIDRARVALARCKCRVTHGRGGRVMSERASWQALRDRRRAEPGATQAYQAARLAFDLGCAIRELRERREWSQAQLAHAAGMTQSAVARFETGGTVPTLPVLERLARALDVELAVEFKPRAAA